MQVYEPLFLLEPRTYLFLDLFFLLASLPSRNLSLCTSSLFTQILYRTILVSLHPHLYYSYMQLASLGNPMD